MRSVLAHERRDQVATVRVDARTVAEVVGPHDVSTAGGAQAARVEVARLHLGPGPRDRIDPKRRHPLILAIAAALSIASCTRTVRVVVPVTPAPCLTERAPRPPEGAPVFGPQWLAFYRALVTWAVETEGACGPEEWRGP